jgi:hypothetical protein
MGGAAAVDGPVRMSLKIEDRPDIQIHGLRPRSCDTIRCFVGEEARVPLRHAGFRVGRFGNAAVRDVSSSTRDPHGLLARPGHGLCAWAALSFTGRREARCPGAGRAATLHPGHHGARRIPSSSVSDRIFGVPGLSLSTGALSLLRRRPSPRRFGPGREDRHFSASSERPHAPRRFPVHPIDRW